MSQAVEGYLKAQDLEAPASLVSKAAELSNALMSHCGVVLVGPPGAGKSCCLHAVQVRKALWHSCVCGTLAAHMGGLICIP